MKNGADYIIKNELSYFKQFMIDLYETCYKKESKALHEAFIIFMVTIEKASNAAHLECVMRTYYTALRREQVLHFHQLDLFDVWCDEIAKKYDRWRIAIKVTDVEIREALLI